MPEADVTIRECVTLDDFQQCIGLERAIWKDEDIGIMPVRLYILSKACNAPTIGAFDPAGRLVGFVHTNLALVGRHVIYHSHLAAVVENLRHKDIGYRIKLAQRERAIEAGIPLVIWTFDPLQSRNAHLNINKLGIIIRRYEENYYPEGVSNIFDNEVPSDRIFAEWWVASPRVKSALAGQRPPADINAPSVVIPEDINAVRARSVADHMGWRMRVRDSFKRELASGRIALGFAREPEKAVSRYIFGEDEEQFQFSSYRGLKTDG